MKKNIVQRQSLCDPQCLSDLDLHPVLKRVYLNRGIAHKGELEKELNGLLPHHDLLNLDLAVARLYQALQQQQKILIIGDYDVDGATSTTLLVKAFKSFGAKYVDFLIPNRFDYGYGLSPAIVNLAEQSQPNLIVTVDNGISSHDGVACANAKGIDVIITDHHLAGQTLPVAVAVVNPNQPDDKFASKNLAGVGVAFYVAIALRAKLRAENWFIQQQLAEPNLAELLDLVALGTVADMVNLDKNNRIFVHHGIERMRQQKCCIGIKALLDVARGDITKLKTTDLGYIIAPRLNAAGRLTDMTVGINCLLTNDFDQAKEFAKQLNKLNVQRRELEKEIRLQAFDDLKEYKLDDQQKLPFGICLVNKDWHQGVVGIVASKIVHHINRPTIVFSYLDEFNLKGSARSIHGLNMRHVLDNIATQNPGLITKFGGHAMAAGLTLTLANYEKFHQLFDAEVRKSLTEEDLQRKIITDGELTPSDLSLGLIELLRQAGPWGQGFPEPLFDNKFNVLEQRLLSDKHLKLKLQLGDSKAIDAIAFNVDNNMWPNHRCEQIHAVYRPTINNYNGWESVQLIIEHLEAINND